MSGQRVPFSRYRAVVDLRVDLQYNNGRLYAQPAAGCGDDGPLDRHSTKDCLIQSRQKHCPCDRIRLRGRSSLAGVGIFLMSLLIQGLIPMKGIPELSEKSSASAPACIEAENVPFLCLSRTRSRNIIPILIKKERSRWTRLHYV